jgi:hypothetical protein
MELDMLDWGIGNGQKQLENPSLVAKAPQKVVEGLRTQQVELAMLRDKTLSKMKELGCS